MKQATADFVAKIGNPFFNLQRVEAFSDLSSAMRYAVAKKAFPMFYLGCLKYGLKLPKDASELMAQFIKRRKKQMDAAKLVVEIQERFGIDLMFFKTFRPFNYIPDDMDLLVYDDNQLAVLIEELKHHGYFVLKVGTPEIVLRKVDKESYVDLDIHKRLAVGSLDLFGVKSLWQKHAYEPVELGDGYQAIKLSEDYEVVREAAYSLLKDFNLSIAGLYLGTNAMLNRDLTVIEKIAMEENFLMHLGLYLNLVQAVTKKQFGASANSLLYDNEPFVTSLCQNIRIPYAYPVPVIVWAYLSKAELEVKRKKNIRVITQIMKQPASKGINVLLDYAREITS